MATDVFDTTAHDVYYFSKEQDNKIQSMSMHVNRKSLEVVKSGHPLAKDFIGKPVQLALDALIPLGYNYIVIL